MTALTRYARLEGSGLWRADAQAQRRDVAVRLGKTSLVIADGRSGAVLSHWALPALRRLNPGRRPACYAPDALEGGETLETDDALLIEAIETIQSALHPRPIRRWLMPVLAVAGLGAVLAGALALPGALIERTAVMAPQAVRAQIAREALDDLVRTGSGVRVCAEPNGRQALTALRNRVLGPGWRALVIEGLAGFEAGHLPGRVALVSRGLLERLDSPEALAGWLIAQDLADQARDPMLAALRHAGLRATLTVLTTGALPEGVLSGYAAQVLTRPPLWPEAAAIEARLADLGVSAAPYAASLPPAARSLAAALPREAVPGVLLMTDGEWLTLQGVCHD